MERTKGFIFTVGETYAMLDRWKNVKTAEVLKVTPTGRATCQITDPLTGHTFKKTFDSHGMSYPRPSFLDFDRCHLQEYHEGYKEQFETALVEAKKNKRAAEKRTREEEAAAKAEREGMEFALELVQQAVDPRQRSAEAALKNWLGIK